MLLRVVASSLLLISMVSINKVEAIDFPGMDLNISYKACYLPDGTVYTAAQKWEECPAYSDLYGFQSTIKSDDTRLQKGWRVFKFCYHNGELFDIKSSDSSCIWENESLGLESKALANIHGGGLHYSVNSYDGNIKNSSGTIDTTILNMHDDNDPDCIVSDPNEGLPIGAPKF